MTNNMVTNVINLKPTNIINLKPTNINSRIPIVVVVVAFSGDVDYRWRWRPPAVFMALVVMAVMAADDGQR